MVAGKNIGSWRDDSIKGPASWTNGVCSEPRVRKGAGGVGQEKRKITGVLVMCVGVREASSSEVENDERGLMSCQFLGGACVCAYSYADSC